MNRSMSYMPQDMKTVSGKKFFVVVARGTNGAHRPIVDGFKSAGQTEVMSPAECDYLLVFCPVASHVGTDISEALDHIPADKKALLVVMHHTFDRHCVASSRLVENPNILLTVDCLFHESELLSCDLNDKIWSEVYNFLGVSQSALCRFSLRWLKTKHIAIIMFSSLVLLIVSYGIWKASRHFFKPRVMKGRWPVIGWVF